MSSLKSWYSASCSRNYLLLWYLKVHHHFHRSPSLEPILSHLNPVPNTPPHSSTILCNIALPSRSRSPEWLLTLKNVDISSSPCAFHIQPSHLCWFNRSSVSWRIQIITFLIMWSFQPPVTSAFLGINILLSF